MTVSAGMHHNNRRFDPVVTSPPANPRLFCLISYGYLLVLLANKRSHCTPVTALSVTSRIPSHRCMTIRRNSPSSSISTAVTTAPTKLASGHPSSCCPMSERVALALFIAFEYASSRGLPQHRRSLACKATGLLFAPNERWCRSRIITSQPRLRHGSLVVCSLRESCCVVSLPAAALLSVNRRMNCRHAWKGHSRASTERDRRTRQSTRAREILGGHHANIGEEKLLYQGRFAAMVGHARKGQKRCACNMRVIR